MLDEVGVKFGGRLVNRTRTRQMPIVDRTPLEFNWRCYDFQGWFFQVFLENGVFVPYRKQVVLTKNGENDDLHSTHKRGCAPQSPETDENDENGGCPSDKTRVCQKQGFRHPGF